VSNRPRSHQIEDQSRIAFEGCLPAQWVYRAVRPDYGIDGSVEIFDERGRATGKQFNVQLKATDKPKLAKALSVKLKIERCEYYRSLDVPVLIARFHAPTGKIFARWFHKFDPYYGKSGRRTRTFTLMESDEWSKDTPSMLLFDLERIRELRFGELPAPAPFSLHFRGDQIQGVSVAEISLSLRQAIQTLPSVLSLTTDTASARGSISISNDDAVVDLGGFKHFTLHFRKPYGIELAKKFLHYDVLLAIALTFDSVGLSDRGARLAAEFAGRSSLATNPEIAIRIARCMAKAHRVSEALDLAEGLLSNRSTRFGAHSLMVSMLAKSGVMSQDERELMRRFLVRYVEVEESTEDKVEAAIANYNLGSYLRSLSYHKAAFRCYRKAARLDQRYLERGYFYGELAGVTFLMKRYKMAASLYDHALRSGESGITQALFGDALLFSGRFSDALQAYEAYLASEKSPKPEFVLKAWSLKELPHTLKVDAQERQGAAAMRLASLDAQMPTADCVNQLEQSLKLDAMCGLAWFNLAKCFVRQGKTEDAFRAFLWASLVQTNDAEAWANAFALCASLSKYGLLIPYVVWAASFACEKRFNEELLKIADSQPQGFPRLAFLNAVDVVQMHALNEDRPFKLRLMGKNGEMKVFPGGWLKEE
jgi:tetratricopeptide (TPR) repeat protein